ncbi:MAG: WD40/YVTN/BNR-like repeat-containing protein [Bacteroidota bacterium]
MRKLLPIILMGLAVVFAAKPIKAQDSILNKKTFSEMKLRNIGPAFMSGRIADIAIHPQKENTWYVAVGSGGVWKTTNAGITWKSIFDKQPVYSIGCVTIDPNNPHTIWVGSGEDVGGRHVGFGDGVYKSTDDGATWKNMGLKNSEHISRIIVHPENSRIIYLASQGPLWSEGGQRGFYKSTDGGETWKRTLGDDEWMGVTDIVIDPRNPERVYAATWQRHRTIAAYMGGGPESGLYRSEDGGETWKELKKGLPSGPMGKIGLAVSPQKPDVLYAAIELNRRDGAVFKTTNRGESWTKQSNTVSGATGPHYYQELYACPHTFDRIYLMDVRTQVSDDGGKNFRRLKEKHKHSDNHAMAFRKGDPDYLLLGTDGGLYESYDKAENWRYIDNLPVTQFYKIALDDSKPFYQVYGGTQDNATEAGPSRTDKNTGITNADWEVVLFADGHQPATEPGNPDIMYAQWQQGNLMRVDRSTGEKVFIQPQPDEGEGYERFNWDCPLIVSPHSPERIYHASHRLWRSDNRGDEWMPVSGDLTNYEERLDMPIMGRKQSWDSPWDISAMSTYNTITTIAESHVKEGLLYVGTDDGLLQVSEDGGENWREIRVEELPGVEGSAYVNDIKADQHDVNTVYVALDRHKFGDFTPYLFKSTDKGETWKSITANLEEPQIVWQIVQDHVDPNLLFIGTEFGLYFSIDDGEKWVELNTEANISFRDIEIHRRENDLVGASFGRGIFILDDYTPLRNLSKQMLEDEALIFSPRDAWWYFPRTPFGGSKKGSQGATYFAAPNPPFGAVLTYYLKEDLKSLKEIRQKKEKKLKEEKKDIDFPGWEALDEEMMQEALSVFLTVLDNKGKVVKKVEGPREKGFHRVNWDLSFSSPQPVEQKEESETYRSRQRSFMSLPGQYRAFLSKKEDGVISVLTDTVSFEVKQLRQGALRGASPRDVVAFWKEVAGFRADVSALSMNLNGMLKKAKAMKKALLKTHHTDKEVELRINKLIIDIKQLKKRMNGSPAKSEIGEKGNPTVRDRMRAVMSGVSSSSYGPAPVHKKTFTLAKKEYQSLVKSFEALTKETIPELEKELEEIGAPYIEGQEWPEK